MKKFLFSLSIFCKNSQKFLAIFSVFLCVLFSQSAFASTYSVSALDSIAGYGSEISVKNAEKNTEYFLLLKTPENSEEKFSQTTDLQGNVRFIIPKKNTYEAGIYSFVVVPKGFEFEDGTVKTFRVFADDPSPSLSKISTEDISLATEKKGEITVLLQDQYGNKISDHRVHLISSRNEDIISFVSNNRTDKNGQIKFTISSEEEGNSRISAFDETAGISLMERKNILFYKNTVSSGSRFSASMFGAGGDDEDTISNGLISEFKVDFPSSVRVHSSDNFLTITAVDAQGKTLKNFTGTVFIRIPDDENAEVPGENGKYTFLKRDEGKFTFSQSLSFSQTGEQTIEVFLYDTKEEEINTNIFGKKTVFVKEDREYQGPITSNDIKIVTPEDNSKFSSSNVSVTGTSIKNSDIKIFLDNIPYKTVSTDDKGVFNFILSDIEDGEHTLFAQQSEGDQKKSSDIKFSVDSKSPEILNFHFSKTTVLPEENITLTLKTKGDAENVSIRIDNEKIILNKISGLWKAEFSAPKKTGEYSVLAMVTDDYGNVSHQTLESSIQVEKPEISEDVLSGEFSEEKNAIILEWKNTLEETPILYILSTGDSESSLKKSKSISGSSTRMEFSDFTAGEKIFMAITPVDASGKEGKISNIVAVQTKKKEVEVIPGPVIEPDPEFSLTSENGQLQVRWESSKNIDTYQILLGIESGDYLQKTQKNAFQNSEVFHDLIPGKKYFVRLLAKDSLGNTVFDYGEKSILIGEVTFHSAPSQKPQPYPEWITKTGPQLFLFIGAIFFIASGIVLGRKQKIKY